MKSTSTIVGTIIRDWETITRKKKNKQTAPPTNIHTHPTQNNKQSNNHKMASVLRLFGSADASSKTFNKKKALTNTLQTRLKTDLQQNYASLGLGQGLAESVKVPQGENKNEWIAVRMYLFHNICSYELLSFDYHIIVYGLSILHIAIVLGLMYQRIDVLISFSSSSSLSQSHKFPLWTVMFTNNGLFVWLWRQNIIP